MKTLRNWLKKQREEFRELAQIIGLTNSVQQMAVGAALCILLLVGCAGGEKLAHIISGF